MKITILSFQSLLRGRNNDNDGENAVLQDALYSLGVTSCPPLTTDGSGRPGLHLRAPPMDGSGFGTVPD